MAINATGSESGSSSKFGNPGLREVHQATIRAHHAKKGYDYSTIHLPPMFLPLIGLKTHIYEMVHNGALASLVVVSLRFDENASMSSFALRIDMAKVGGSNPAEPISFLGCFDEMRAPGSLLALC